MIESTARVERSPCRVALAAGLPLGSPAEACIGLSAVRNDRPAGESGRREFPIADVARLGDRRIATWAGALRGVPWWFWSRISNWCPATTAAARCTGCRKSDMGRFERVIEQYGSGAGPRVVGYFRSHTRKGLSLDPDDVAFLDARFREPQQIALLVRPFASKASTGAIFIRENGNIRAEGSYLEFPFRSSQLTPAANSAEDRECQRCRRAAIAGGPEAARSRADRAHRVAAGDGRASARARSRAGASRLQASQPAPVVQPPTPAPAPKPPAEPAMRAAEKKIEKPVEKKAEKPARRRWRNPPRRRRKRLKRLKR